MSFPLLSLQIWLPLISAALILAWGNNRSLSCIKWFSLIITLIVLGLSTYMYLHFNPNLATMQFVESYNWIPAFNIKYSLGVDGIAMPLVALTSYTHLLVVLAAWRLIREHVAEYFAVFLIIYHILL